MLNIKLVRENPEAIKANIARRHNAEKVSFVDKLLEKDAEWKREKGELDFLRSQRNTISQRINQAKKEGKDLAPVLEEAKKIPAQVAEKEKLVEKLEEETRYYLMRIPNLLHESVPDGENEEANEVVKLHGKKHQFSFNAKNHIELMESFGLADIERATKISGARFYFLRGGLAEMELALQKYAADFMVGRGFTLTHPPFMMNKATYEGVVDLGAFEEALYKIDGEDLYLIATSEHPMTGMFSGEVFDESKLPVKVAGYSTCFRKEAGAHGKDTKGIFRVHQFNKVEQVVICKPEDSWQFHEEMLKNVQGFFESLGLHFRTIVLSSADSGSVVAKTYDLEAWMPASQEFREMASCSNCTAYQATRLNIKYQKGQEKEFVHTLNSTCVATSRALCAILEQNQQADGTVKVPDILVPYMNGKKFIK